MQQLPVIFEKDRFIEPSDTSGLDAPTLARLDGVRVASRNLIAAQAAEQAAADNIGTCMEAITAAQEYFHKHYPPDDQHKLWIDTFGSEKDRARYYAARKAK